MRVIVINDFASVAGGSERVALGEAKGLADRGHDVTMITGHAAAWTGLAEAGVELVSTGQPTTLDNPSRARAAIQGIWNQKAAALVEKCAGVSQPNDTVIHIHSFTKVLSTSVVRAAVRSGHPTVATLHDYFVACPNGGFFNFQTNEICRLKPLSARCIFTHSDVRGYSHKLWRVGRTAVQRTLGEMPSGVGQFIVPSHFAGEIVRPFLPRDAELHVVPNPVVATRLPRATNGDNSSFAFVGRIRQEKGPRVFAEAARRAGVPALFIGDGEDVDEVRKANPDAELTGWMDPDEVQVRLRSARSLVNASLCYETQGLAALEAAAQGIPSLVPDSSALREVVVDGVTGLWFAGGDVDDLVAKLTRLRDDHELVSTLGRGAYERFWTGNWDMETHLDRLESIYLAAQR